MKEDELKYLLRLLDGADENIYEEIIQLFYDIEESKQCKEFSEVVLSFFKKNLKSNPVTCSAVLTYFQTNLAEDEINQENIQNVYQDVLHEELLETDSVDKMITFTSLLKLQDKFLPQFIEEILKYVAKDTFKQYRKQILISLLPQGRPELLKITAEFMRNCESQKEFKLTPEYMLDLCYNEKTHWLLKGAQIYKQQLQDMKTITFRINNFTKQILLMVLIDLTNSPESYDLPSLVHQLSNIYSILDTYTTADEHLQYYMTEVKRELTIIKFCLENNCKILTTSVFSQALTQSALAVISQLCRLPKVDRYKISRLLNANSETVHELTNLSNKSNQRREKSDVNWDILTYNSYCAITKVIDTIMLGSEGVEDVSPSLDEVRRLVLSIQPVQYCVEVIENIFSCLFVRYEYFSCEEHAQDSVCGAHSDCSYFYSKKQSKSSKQTNTSTAGFMCNSLTTQTILNTLKICLESIEEKMADGHPARTKFKSLVKAVNHAIWKLQLVSTLSPDTTSVQLKLCFDYVEVDDSSDDEGSEHEHMVVKRKTRPKRRYANQKSSGDSVMVSSTISANDEGYVTPKGDSIDFVSIMLAQPNCLVALALFHNDFAKANQIIEMFDLADAEIATEVAFTEQLRHLVAKIKNIIYYKDDTRYPKELSTLSVVSTEVMSLVEGFLASNRAPNSFDIIDLSARHPHLQLYSHQNAPFINAVDILLSSGLNREITYGVINVVERKLTEVRTGTDVAAVKKTNYIRFVEDIASVMFKIYGNTDKSFEFVDNICGLINDCRIPIKHKDFVKLNSLSKELRKSCEDLHDIVNNKDSYQFDQNSLQKYHQVYMNVVAASDKDVCNVGDVSHGNKKTRTHYLRMCYNYCKTVAMLEQTDDRSTISSSDTPYFSILEKQLHDIFGNMIKSKEIPITTLEPICKKLNVNLIPKLIMNFCPPIPLSKHSEANEATFNNLLQIVYNFKNTEENLFIDPVANFAPLCGSPDPQCLTYIVLHNWVLAHIIKKIHTTSEENNVQQSTDERTKYVNNFMELERFDYLKVLFDNNKYLASLHTTIDLDELFLYMPKLVQAGKIHQCLNIIDALAENQLMSSPNLLNLRDLILFKLAINPNVENNWKYCQHLRCPELKVNLILNNLSLWPLEGALEVLDYLRFLLDQTDLDEGLYEKCNEWMMKIPLYDQIASIMNADHWYAIYEKSLEAPEEVIEILMDNQQFKLCLEWADVHEVSDNMKSLITVNLLRQLFEYTNQATPQQVSQLLLRLPTSQAVDLVHEEMAKVRNVEILQVCVEFITENSTDWKSFENIKVGLQIMLEMDSNLRSVFWELIERPLLMVEQFLMNAKLDVLTDIMNKISPMLKRDPTGDNLYYNIKCIESLVISRNAVDSLLRFYAEKALDMKNPRAYSPPPRVSDDCLLQSIDSINIEASNKPFVMPEEVPTKERWVQDGSTDKCMMCHTSIFSMIIRRHHCRRCGRVVCHACSRHRMQVPTYPSGVKFRVCDDCYTQTMSKKSTKDGNIQSSNSESATSGGSLMYMDWCLSINAKRNEAVREEFSFEFTPNVTLCLSIMKMHSINLDYPRFLLDRSDEVSRSLASGADARLAVRARRSLLLAAAELYSRLPQRNGGDSSVAETGALHAARCLAHADSMAALVRHAARHLLPSHGAHPSHIVRSLLEAEKWELALEIATKSGLPRNSVIAAWGKACLKAGCFKQAREKFAHCFKNAPQVNVCTEFAEECEYGREASESSPLTKGRMASLRRSSRCSSSSQAEGRARTSPPLLAEIVAMLEDLSYPVSPKLLEKAEAMQSTNEKLTLMNTKKKIPLTEPALNIMHTLASVRRVKAGDFSDLHTAPPPPKKSLAQGLLRRNNSHVEPKIDVNRKLDPFFYKECVYYLSNYGSHVANIAFHMKHSDLAEVLKYCNENMVDKETFTESVFMECLKKEKVEELFKCMGEMDASLEMWGEFITHICRSLECAGRLESLYRVQCASAQQARAAATCARLYARPASRVAPFVTLLAREPTLHAATTHLSSCLPLPAKSLDPKSFHLRLDKATIDRHMTTVARQIELAKFLAACESANRLTEKMVSEISGTTSSDESRREARPLTLFGSNCDKLRLSALVLVAGTSIDDGFPLAFRIITENKLDSMNAYTLVARYLVGADRFAEVAALARCVRASKETAATLMSDQVLETGVRAVVARCEARGQLHDEQAELLIQDVQSVSVKISCYLACRILSSAYILAAKHERTGELRRVLHEAERLGSERIRGACLRRLAAKHP